MPKRVFHARSDADFRPVVARSGGRDVAGVARQLAGEGRFVRRAVERRPAEVARPVGRRRPGRRRNPVADLVDRIGRAAAHEHRNRAGRLPAADGGDRDGRHLRRVRELRARQHVQYLDEPVRDVAQRGGALHVLDVRRLRDRVLRQERVGQRVAERDVRVRRHLHRLVLEEHEVQVAGGDAVRLGHRQADGRGQVTRGRQRAGIGAVLQFAARDVQLAEIQREADEPDHHRQCETDDDRDGTTLAMQAATHDFRMASCAVHGVLPERAVVTGWTCRCRSRTHWRAARSA